MDAQSLKKYIYENNRVEFVLQNIGCHSIEYHPSKNYYSCANYNGDNKTAINVRNNEYLDVKNWTREKEFKKKSDILTLVQYNKQSNFTDAIKYLHNILGLKYKAYTPAKKTSVEEEDKVSIWLPDMEDITDEFYKNNPIHALDEQKLKSYEPRIYEDWYRNDGVMPWTRKKFGLAYSYEKKRVIIPLRYWATGELIGINMRTVVEYYDVFGIKKYIITPGYPKHLNLYGLYENMEAIKKTGYVVVYEAEKSVLKRDSRNDPTGVALSGHAMSYEQVRILMGLNVDIIISMDKDIDINTVRAMCEHFYKIRNVYYTLDTIDILGEKDSVADANNKNFAYLMEHKIKYDEKEHKEFIRYMNDK